MASRKASAASAGSPIRTTGALTPRASAAAASSSRPPTAKNGLRPSASRRVQASASSSGPTPAGSPSETARGAVTPRSSIVVDDRVAAQVAQVHLRPLVDAVVFHLRHQLIEAGAVAGLRIVAAAEH